MDSIEIKFKKLDKKAVIPKMAHDGDVCADVTAIGVDYNPENDSYIYHTGLAVETEKGVGIMGFLRSSNCRTDCYLTNMVGIIDSAIYRGEIKFVVKLRDDIYSRALKDMFYKNRKNKESKHYTIEDTIANMMDNPLDYAPYKVGERIGQIMPFKYYNIDAKEVSELSETVRGDGGFGSTGK